MAPYPPEEASGLVSESGSEMSGVSAQVQGARTGFRDRRVREQETEAEA